MWSEALVSIMELSLGKELRLCKARCMIVSAELPKCEKFIRWSFSEV